MPFSVIANDYTDDPISIDSYLVTDRTASYLLRVEGDSMRHSAAICAGDLVLVNTALPLRAGAIVAACIEGAFTLRRYAVRTGQAWLMPDPGDMRPAIRMADGDDFTIFGTVTAVIRKLKSEK